MQPSQATLYCPNPNCQTPNPESNQFCQQCQTLLPKRYLWVAGDPELPVGELLAGRYQVKGPRVVLETQPGLPLPGPAEIPAGVEPYLKLFPYRLHIPQVYGLLEHDVRQQSQPLLLLEQAPLNDDDFASPPVAGSGGRALPLTQAWAAATAVRQLNWLWQMAQLWQPLSSQGAATSLLHPKLLRVEGPLVRLLELELDAVTQPFLSQLGDLWSQWLPQAQVTIAPGLEQLCQHLVEEQIQSPEQLLAQLNHWLMLASKSQSYRVQLATQTDQGPTRQRNEDACYPPSGTSTTADARMLVMVCDGVGGHAGGDVASGLAIAACRQHLENLPLDMLTPDQLMDALETAVCHANDMICKQNDQEQRHDRQRMGTTLVLSLVRGPEIYFVHVGDSRAYWITPAGCYQITLDDDVASRDVRLGYGLYRDALRQPVAGSLIQALGMGPSSLLRPTVQRFFVDADCLFLLCSDGLSDYDRVEESWQTTLLPILEGQDSLPAAGQRLIELANHLNGHDNVTVGLLRYQVTGSNLAEPLSAGLELGAPRPETFQPPVPQAQQPRRSRLLPLVITLLILVLGGALAYWFLLPLLSQRLADRPTPLPSSSPLAPGSPAAILPTNPLSVGTFLRVEPPSPREAASAASPSPRLTLLEQPGQPQRLAGSVLTGTVLQVVSRQTLAEQGSWVRLKVCSAPQRSLSPAVVSPLPNPSVSPPGRAPLQTGSTGWIQESVITRATEPRTLSQLGPNQRSACTPTSPPSMEASPAGES